MKLSRRNLANSTVRISKRLIGPPRLSKYALKQARPITEDRGRDFAKRPVPLK